MKASGQAAFADAKSFGRVCPARKNWPYPGGEPPSYLRHRRTVDGQCGQASGCIALMDLGKLRVRLGQALVQNAVVDQYPAECLLELYRAVEYRLIPRQRPQPRLAELHPGRLHSGACNPASEAHHRSQHRLNLMRTEGKLALPGMVNQPGGSVAGDNLETPAIGDQPLETLNHHDGFPKRGCGLQRKADAADTHRGKLGPNFQAKPRIAGAALGGVPEPGDIVDRPAFQFAGGVRNTRLCQQLVGRYRQPLRSTDHGVDPANGNRGL